MVVVVFMQAGSMAECDGGVNEPHPFRRQILRVVSSCGRDELVELFGWGVPAERFAWSSVE